MSSGPGDEASSSNAPSDCDDRARALDVVGVTAGYDRTTVLRDVDLHVGRGEVVALLGANGAGKTTLLRTIVGSVHAGAGQVLLGGRDVTRLRPEHRVRRGLCVVPEGRGVFPSLSVRDNIELQSPRGARYRGPETVLAAFPTLRQGFRRRAGTLSGGQRQMLALGRCLLASPTMVLLDEVSMGLAPRVIDEIYVALRRIADSGAALLLVEQYVERALDVADRVYVLDRGRIAFSGAADELTEADLAARYLGGGGIG